MMRKRKIIGIIGLVLILVIVLFYVVRIRPMVKEYKKIAYDKLANIDEDTFAKLENTKVYGKNGELIGEVNSGSYQYKKISEISKYVQDGYIAVEDKNFKSHHGIDYLATVRAGIKLVLNRGKATQGGSTITQQLVKNSFLSQKKTFTRKIAEFFLAPEIEKMYTKPQIMEYYCNSNYYGNRCYGIGNAASYYFHKNADQLTLSEAALLVGLSNNPSRYDPVTNYNSSIRKRDRVLKHMLDAKVISKTQYQQAKNEKIEIAEYRKNVKPEGYQTSFAIYQATLELMKKNGFEFQYTFQDKEDEKKYKERYQEEYQKYLETPTIDFDFSDRPKGKFICFLTGHLHCAFITTSMEYKDQLAITVPAASTGAFERQNDDIKPISENDDNFYILEINTKNKNISIDKIGTAITSSGVLRDRINLKYE